jgi:hypothetical protein
MGSGATRTGRGEGPVASTRLALEARRHLSTLCVGIESSCRAGKSLDLRGHR